MVDAGIMSSQSNSKDMAMLQAGIDSMTVQNDSVGRAYFKEAMNGTYKITADLKKADTLKIEQAHLGRIQCRQSFQCSHLITETEDYLYCSESCGKCGKRLEFQEL